MAPSTSIGRSALWAQARACTPGPADPRSPAIAVEGPGSALVPLALLATAALLALSVALPSHGLLVPGAASAYAAPSASELVAGPEQLADLPGTGTSATSMSTTGTSSNGTSSTGTDASGGGSVPALAPRPAAPAVSACTGPCSTTQNVSVTILPGPLAISLTPMPLVVRTDGDGVGSGRLSETRVIDLRGASPGWTLTATLASVVDAAGAPVVGATAELTPTCTRTAGPLTLESADTSLVGVGQVASLCVVPLASAGSLAGGLVSATAAVTVRGAHPGTVVQLRFATSVA